jgi:hypothetical protein
MEVAGAVASEGWRLPYISTAACCAASIVFLLYYYTPYW